MNLTSIFTPGSIVYKKEIERFFYGLHTRLTEFLGPAAIDKEIPTYLQIYRDDRIHSEDGITSYPPHTWKAYSNKKTTKATEKMLNYFPSYSPGCYIPREHIIIVSGIESPNLIEWYAAHETGHAIVGDLHLQISETFMGNPKTIGDVAGIYKRAWDHFRQEALQVFNKREQEFPLELLKVLKGISNLEVDLTEFYSDLCGHLVDISTYHRDIEERINLERVMKVLDEGIESIVVQPLSLDNPSEVMWIFKNILLSAHHIPAWAAYKLVHDQGSVQAVADRGVLNMSKEELWDYLANIEI
jgi:hypothetical protein